MVLRLTVVIVLCSLVSSQLVDEEERLDWVDPSDMLNFDSTSGTMNRRGSKQLVIEPLNSVEMETEAKENSKNTEESASLSCDDLDKCLANKKQLRKTLKSCQDKLDNIPPSQAAYLKQFIRVLVEKLPDAHYQLQHQESVAFSATLLLSQADLDLFNELIYTERGRSLQDSHRTLVDMIQEVKLHSGEYRPQTWYSWVSDIVRVHLTTGLQLTAVFALATIGVQATMHIRVSWLSFFRKLLLLLFLISIPWNWWHLYKIELAQRQAKAIQDMPAECNPEDQSVWGLLVNAFSVNVDKCAKYHEQMMVDPIWEVAPTRAIAVTLTKFCVEPLEHIGRSLGKFLRAPLEDLPVQMWPIVLIFLVVIFTLALIMSFGYKIRLFYLFGIEPDSSRGQIQGAEEIQKGIQALTTQVEMLTQNSRRADDTEKIVERQLQALTATPHWEGRALMERYPSQPQPPRYMVENVGYPRGMDVVDSRVGPTGEGSYLPMPAPPPAHYPPSQPTTELYPAVGGHNSVITQPSQMPVLQKPGSQFPNHDSAMPAFYARGDMNEHTASTGTASAKTSPDKKQDGIITKLTSKLMSIYPKGNKEQKLEPDTTTSSVPEEAMHYGNPEKSSDEKRDGGIPQTKKSIPVETVTAKTDSCESECMDFESRSNENDLEDKVRSGIEMPSAPAVNGACGGEAEMIDLENVKSASGIREKTGLLHVKVLEDTTSVNGSTDLELNGNAEVNTNGQVEDEQDTKVVSLKPEVENLGSEG